MALIHGFELLSEREIPELRSRAKHYRHARTGAELVSVVNDDENKSFGITFRTPPSDSTGVSHILEHSVLCGSKRFPLKDPFAELMKSSLQTYLNASTYPDKTCYPVASTNLKDFYNLVDVYLDLLLNPLLTRETFEEQGWHYELTDPSEPLRYKGVVFNEMKGAYSNPDGILSEKIQQSLFPGHVYGVDSGGDPERIPDLTYEQFTRFHADYYHPSNARVYFFGDDPPERRLELIDAAFARFDRKSIESSIPLAQPWDRPQRKEWEYAAAEGTDEPGARRSYATVNWLLRETPDSATRLALDVLGRILVGTSASPLRKALIDSGLGSDLAGGGMLDYLRQSYFAIGLKGIEPISVDAVENIIVDTLERLATEGIDPETIEASMNTIEFRLRELNTGNFPRGLALMVHTLSTWLHGHDPLDALPFEEALAEVRSGAATPGYFEGLIRRLLLDNPHRSTVALHPDPALEERQSAAEEARLETAKRAMTPADLETVKERTEALLRLQNEPTSPDKLASLPTLTLADLDPEVKTIPLDVSAGGRWLYHDLFTSRIAYVDLGLDLRSLPAELLPYASLFGRALVELGTETEDEVRLIQRIGRDTGGISRSLWISGLLDGPGTTAWLVLRGKVMADQAGKLTSLYHDILLKSRLDHPTRFRQMVLEEKARLESSLAPAGSAYVDSRLRATFTQSDWADEATSGIEYLFFLRRLAERIDREWPAVLADLESVRARIVDQGRVLVNVTVDSGRYEPVRVLMDEMRAALPDRRLTDAPWPDRLHVPEEGLAIPSPVNYVGKGGSLSGAGFSVHGSYLAITNFLNASWLWDRVRKEGGAYGVRCGLDPFTHVFAFVSYRDPNLAATLAAYDGASGFLRSDALTETELMRTIIGAIGSMDRHLLPDARGYLSMVRYLTRNTDERRQRIRTELLGAQPADFWAFADALDHVRENGRVAVLGSRHAIDSANDERPGWLAPVEVLADA